MDKITTREEDLLLHYLDGQVQGDALMKLEQMLQTSPPLRARLEELRLAHNLLLKSATVEVPSRNFTQRVMKQLDSFPTPQVISPRNGILLLCGVMVAVGVALMMMKAGTFDHLNGTISLDIAPLTKEWIKRPLPTLPVNGKMVINAILIFATGISFIVLDRTILRPMFNRRAGTI